MEMTVTHAGGGLPVAVIAVRGDLDAANYQQLIGEAQALYDSGTRGIVLDLGETRFVSSSGLVAMHSIALLLSGQKAPNPEEGWSALHAVADRDGTSRQALKLANPQPQVDRVLQKVGFREIFEVYDDVGAAVASF